MSFGGTSLQRGILRTVIGSFIAMILCWAHLSVGSDELPYGAMVIAAAFVFVMSLLGLWWSGVPERER